MSCQTIIKTHTAAKLFICSKNPFFLQINFEFSRLNIKLIFMNFHGKKKNLKWIFGQKKIVLPQCVRHEVQFLWFFYFLKNLGKNHIYIYSNFKPKVRSGLTYRPIQFEYFNTFLHIFFRKGYRGKWSLTVIRIYDRFYVNMMQRVKKWLLQKSSQRGYLFVNWRLVEFEQLLQKSRTHLKTNPRKKWPQFLCNTLFEENKNVTELISDFHFYFQFLFLVEYFRIILENVQHYFRYIFSFISDFFFKINFYF